MREFFDLVKTILTSPTGLVALLGLILLGLGAAGGVSFNGWFVIDHPFWRPALAVLGTLLVVAAAAKLLYFSGRAVVDAAELKNLGI